jgi:hypothetical protein
MEGKRLKWIVDLQAYLLKPTGKYTRPHYGAIKVSKNTVTSTLKEQSLKEVTEQRG